MSAGPVLNPPVRWDDPNWVVVEGVPILDEHELVIDGDDGKPSRLQINKPVLELIAANNNRRVAHTGDTVMLIDGHTSDDPGAAQPEILGEADHFWVAPLFDTGRHALFARFKYDKDPAKFQKARKLGRRSVELWLDRWEIDPIALLGATAPERNLGVLRLSRVIGRAIGQAGQARYTLCRVSQPVRYYADAAMFSPASSGYQQGYSQDVGVLPQPQPQGPTGMPQQVNGGNPAVPPEVLAAIMQALQGTDLFRQLQAMLQQQQQAAVNPTAAMGGMGGGMPGMPGMGGPPGMGGGPDPMAMLMQLLQGPGQGGGQPGGGRDGDGDDRVRMQADTPGQATASLPGYAPAYGSGGNTYLPSALSQVRRTSHREPSYMSQQYSHNGNGQAVVNPAQMAVLPQQPQPQQPQQSAALPNPLVPEPLEAQVVRLQRQVHDLTNVNRHLQVMLELAGLAAEGIEFDPTAEVPFLAQMDDNNRAVRYQHMRRYYRNRNEQRVQYAAQAQYGQQPQQPGPFVYGPGQTTQPVPQPQQAPGLVRYAHPAAQPQPGYQPQFLPGQVPVPQPAVGLPGVPLQHQVAQPASLPGQEEAPTAEEHEAIIEVMTEMKQNNQEPDYHAALQQVRYGRRRAGLARPGQQPVPGQERVY